MARLLLLLGAAYLAAGGLLVWYLDREAKKDDPRYQMGPVASTVVVLWPVVIIATAALILSGLAGEAARAAVDWLKRAR